MSVVLTETYCNKVNIQITQWDDFIQKDTVVFIKGNSAVRLELDAFACNHNTLNFAFSTASSCVDYFYINSKNCYVDVLCHCR